MFRVLKGLFFPLGFLLLSCTATKITMHSLMADIKTELAKQKGDFAVGFKDLYTGKKMLINGSAVFHAASTMKTPVLIEVYKQAAEGKFSLADSVIIRNEFKSIVDGSLYSLDSTDDSEQELYRHIGEKRTINALLYQMITVSSNFATNLVIGLVDAKNVTQTMRQLGANDILVLRGVEDNKAFAKGLNNTTTAHDLLLIFEKMAKGETVNPEASNAMIHILLEQHFSEIIPAQLPLEVKVAHKTGSITGVQHDSGIIFLPDGRKYVLVILSKNLGDEKEAVRAMANVSRRVYDYMVSVRK
jgi:beta-lactamase class A